MKWIAPAALAAACTLAGCAGMDVASPQSRAAYEAAVASPLRTEGDRKLDATRHPVEFLAFAQVKAGEQVLDVVAGGGYTTQLLALAVGPTGKVWAQAQKPSESLAKRLSDHPQGNITVTLTGVEDPVPPGAGPFDLVTLVNNYHDISYSPIDRAKMNQRIFAALKPGGRYVVVDHSAVAGSGISAGKTLHRIDEAVVKQEAKAAGFELEAEGDFMRNPADPRTGPSAGPQATVTSDRFALRFVKPGAKGGRY